MTGPPVDLGLVLNPPSHKHTSWRGGNPLGISIISLDKVIRNNKHPSYNRDCNLYIQIARLNIIFTGIFFFK